jgi:hypothetical protein
MGTSPPSRAVREIILDVTKHDDHQLDTKEKRERRKSGLGNEQ